MLITEITYLGRLCTSICDIKCEKAWGINNRPFEQLSDNIDDIVWLADHELGDAPEDPGTYEGGHRKPSYPESHNKWCIRECERSEIVPTTIIISQELLKNWNERRYNIDSRRETKEEKR